MIDADELKKAVRESKLKISNRELEELIDNIDNNENRLIDYTEFIASTVDINKICTDEKLSAIFDCFDVDHTGILTFETIKKAFTKFGKDIPDRDIMVILESHDLDQDNKLSFEEFKIMMK